MTADDVQRAEQEALGHGHHLHHTFQPQLYGILPENKIFSDIQFDSYAPPGEHAQCAITFRAPKPNQLRVDECTEDETRICEALVDNFTSNVSDETLFKLLQESHRARLDMILNQYHG